MVCSFFLNFVYISFTVGCLEGACVLFLSQGYALVLAACVLALLRFQSLIVLCVCILGCMHVGMCGVMVEDIQVINEFIFEGLTFWLNMICLGFLFCLL